MGPEASGTVRTSPVGTSRIISAWSAWVSVTGNTTWSPSGCQPIQVKAIQKTGMASTVT